MSEGKKRKINDADRKFIKAIYDLETEFYEGKEAKKG